MMMPVRKTSNTNGITRKEALRRLAEASVMYDETIHPENDPKEAGMVFGNPEIMKAAGFNLDGCYMPDVNHGYFRYPEAKEFVDSETEELPSYLTKKIIDEMPGDIPVEVPTPGTSSKGQPKARVTQKGANKEVFRRNARRDAEREKVLSIIRVLTARRRELFEKAERMIWKDKKCKKKKKYQAIMQSIEAINEKLEQYAKEYGIPVRPIPVVRPKPKKEEGFFSSIANSIKRFYKKHKKAIKKIVVIGITLLTSTLAKTYAPDHAADPAS